MTAVVVAFSGSIASGKSTLARGLARHFDWSYASFGERVRKVALARGKDAADTTVLQDLGEILVRNELEAFCQDVLLDGHWRLGQSLILDGLRHLQVAAEICRLIAPTPFIKIYVSADRSVRARRLRERSPNAPDLAVLERHPMESQSQQELSAKADLSVDGTGDSTTTTLRIASWLANEGIKK